MINGIGLTIYDARDRDVETDSDVKTHCFSFVFLGNPQISGEIGGKSCRFVWFGSLLRRILAQTTLIAEDAWNHGRRGQADVNRISR